MNLTTIVTSDKPNDIFSSPSYPFYVSFSFESKKPKPEEMHFAMLLCSALSNNYYVNDCKCWSCSLVLTFNFVFLFCFAALMECITLQCKLDMYAMRCIVLYSNNIYALSWYDGKESKEDNNEKQQHNELPVSHFEFHKHIRK